MPPGLNWLERLILQLIFGKDWMIMMAMLFAQRVILGKTTFANVPEKLKAQVYELLVDSGLEELADGWTSDTEE